MFSRWVYTLFRVVEYLVEYRDWLCLKAVSICLSITRDGPWFNDMSFA